MDLSDEQLLLLCMTPGLACRPLGRNTVPVERAHETQRWLPAPGTGRRDEQAKSGITENGRTHSV